CGAGGWVESVGPLPVRPDVPRQGNVTGHEANRFLDLANATEPGVLGALAGLDKSLPRGGQTVPIEFVAPALPRVLGQGDRCAEVRGLANGVPGDGEQISDPLGFPRVSHLRGADEILQERVVHELTLED